MNAKETLVLWQRFRRTTVDHPLSCDCKDCSWRRKLGARLVLPYSGPVKFACLREEK